MFTRNNCVIYADTSSNTGATATDLQSQHMKKPVKIHRVQTLAASRCEVVQISNELVVPLHSISSSHIGEVQAEGECSPHQVEDTTTATVNSHPRLSGIKQQKGSSVLPVLLSFNHEAVGKSSKSQKDTNEQQVPPLPAYSNNHLFKQVVQEVAWPYATTSSSKIQAYNLEFNRTPSGDIIDLFNQDQYCQQKGVTHYGNHYLKTDTDMQRLRGSRETKPLTRHSAGEEQEKGLILVGQPTEHKSQLERPNNWNQNTLASKSFSPQSKVANHSVHKRKRNIEGRGTTASSNCVSREKKSTAAQMFSHSDYDTFSHRKLKKASVNSTKFSWNGTSFQRRVNSINFLKLKVGTKKDHQSSSS